MTTPHPPPEATGKEEAAASSVLEGSNVEKSHVSLPPTDQGAPAPDTLRRRAPIEQFHAAMARFRDEAATAFAEAVAWSGTEEDASLGLGSLLRTHRAALGLTLQQVADRAGLTKSHVWEIEDGRSRNPTVRAVYGLSVALGVPVTAVLRAAVRDLEQDGLA